jgi:hypothetical protein
MINLMNKPSDFDQKRDIPSSARVNTSSLLEALQSLRDSGILSEEEFQIKIQEIRNRYRRIVAEERQDEAERRRAARKQVRYFLTVLDQTTKEQIGLLVDLNTEGAMIIRESKLDLGKRSKIRIVLPEEIDGAKFIELDVESMWCEKDINPSFYAVGFEFRSISERNKHLIVRLMNTFGVMTIDQPRQ